MSRRRPVPFEWRDQYHHLRISTKAWGSGIWRASHSRGKCACGAEWPDSPRSNNLSATEVRDRWNDHVEACYYEQENRK